MVEVELSVSPRKKHKKVMFEAAAALTDNRDSIIITESADNSDTLVAAFTMKKARQTDVVDKVGDEFSENMPDYDTSSISFPKNRASHI